MATKTLTTGIEDRDFTMDRLPRLAVVGEVFPERTNSGALLLHRLLSEYPPEKLLVLYSADTPYKNAESLLPGVTYRPIDYNIPRIIKNRLNTLWPYMTALYMRGGLSEIDTAIGDFRPQAILGVPHWYLWLAGAAYARKKRIPFHLISHDDWSFYMSGGGRINRWGLRNVMAAIYREAASRLCVSPGMIEQYQDWFGVDGDLLYPSRGDDSPDTVVRVRPRTGRSPVAAYCGMIHAHQPGVLQLLRQLAGTLTQLGGQLLLFTKRLPASLKEMGLDLPAIRVVDFLPPKLLAEQVSESADFLFLPASFHPAERVDTSTLFPSKLADYTAIGLPILLWGPTYSSAGRWAGQNPDATVSVTELDIGAVKHAILSIMRDSEFSMRLAKTAVDAGLRCFTATAARGTLYTHLQKPALE